ncbi:MAG: polymer-forming cytoskeletal protein, partial [Anaerolineales bacterium]|nr:polymer-forming cytoskeletal protein [Anaerolineales bacterium]
MSGYRVGDIQLDEPVSVLPQAHIVGNIIAPRLRVAGMVYGSTAAHDTIILKDGQIWGDVHTGRLEVAAGGRVQGWVSSLDSADYQRIREEGVVPAIEPGAATAQDLPANGRSVTRSDAQNTLLRRLQDEAASALAARVELEQTFDKRLQEVAGETTARLA